MARAVAAFNILTGASMSELDGWLFMSILKIARATAGLPHIDDAVDLAGYAALAAECIAAEVKTVEMAKAAGIETFHIDKTATPIQLPCCQRPDLYIGTDGGTWCNNCNALAFLGDGYDAR